MRRIRAAFSALKLAERGKRTKKFADNLMITVNLRQEQLHIPLSYTIQNCENCGKLTIIEDIVPRCH